MTADADAARSVGLTGAKLATEIRARVAVLAAALTEAGRPPRLAVVVATADESTAWYVRSIAAAASKVGIASWISGAPQPARRSRRRCTG